MHASDIAIQLTVALEHPLGVRRTWPPQVLRRSVFPGFEGLPRRFGTYQWTSRVGARDVYIFITFGHARRTDQQLSRVNAELRRARLG